MALCVKKCELYISAVLSLLWTGNVFLDDVFFQFSCRASFLVFMSFLKGIQNKLNGSWFLFLRDTYF